MGARMSALLPHLHLRLRPGSLHYLIYVRAREAEGAHGRDVLLNLRRGRQVCASSTTGARIGAELTSVLQGAAVYTCPCHCKRQMPVVEVHYPFSSLAGQANSENGGKRHEMGTCSTSISGTYHISAQ